MTAATFFAVRTPPSSGGVFIRARSIARTSGVKRGPRAVAAAQVAEARRPEVTLDAFLETGRTKPVSRATAAQRRPSADNRITGSCCASVASRRARQPA
jgi:hypothetical protein